MIISGCRCFHLQAVPQHLEINTAALGQGKDLGVGIQQTVTDNQDFFAAIHLFPIMVEIVVEKDLA